MKKSMAQPLLHTSTANGKPDAKIAATLARLGADGVRLGVNGSGKLVVVVGSLNDLHRKAIEKSRGGLLRHLAEARTNRSAELSEGLAFWKGQCTAEAGFEWDHDPTWRTEFEGDRLEVVSDLFLMGEVELDVVHRAFVRYAKAHRRRMRAQMRATPMLDKYKRREVPFEDVIADTEPGDTRLRSAVLVTPQWEPTAEWMDEMLSFFNLTPEEMAT